MGRGGRKGKVVGAHLDEWETDKEDSVSIDGAIIKGLKGYANCTLSHGIDTRIPGRYRWKVKVPKGGAQMAIGKEEDTRYTCIHTTTHHILNSILNTIYTPKLNTPLTLYIHP